MSDLNIEKLKKKVTDRIIDFWTGESNNPKVDTAKKISDLVNELKDYKWEANSVTTGEKQANEAHKQPNTKALATVSGMFSAEKLEQAYWDGRENEASAGGCFDIENYR